MTKLVFLAFMAMAVALGEAATITVGGTTGWTIPSNTDFYDEWEGNQNIVNGDILEFNFAQGGHDVARVTETAYDSCNLNSPIFTQTTSPFSFVINETSNYYFICTFGNHCSRGQKLAITDVKASSTVNGPTSSATPPPPPPPNSAHSLASAISLVVITIPIAIAVAIAVAFLG